MLVDLFNDLATGLDALADARDANDQPAMDAALATITGIATVLVTVEDSAEYLDLVRTCPGVGSSG